MDAVGVSYVSLLSVALTFFTKNSSIAQLWQSLPLNTPLRASLRANTSSCHPSLPFPVEWPSQSLWTWPLEKGMVQHIRVPYMQKFLQCFYFGIFHGRPPFSKNSQNLDSIPNIFPFRLHMVFYLLSARLLVFNTLRKEFYLLSALLLVFNTLRKDIMAMLRT